MRIARLVIENEPRYVVGDGNENWIALDDLGITINDSGELAAALGQIRTKRDGWTGTTISRDDSLVFLPPIERPVQSIAIGRNYALHVKETGSDLPAQPVIFSKLPSSFTGTDSSITVDSSRTSELDYEVELVVMIGKEAKGVSQDDALDYVAGYLVGNDISARDCQRRDGQFDFAKGMDTFGPLGPWLTTSDEIPDPQNLNLKSTVDGQIRQSSNTEHMIFSIPFLIEYISAVVTLRPGDLIWTGTPHGVALGMPDKPFLQHGQNVTCEIEGLGTVSNTVAFV